MDKLNWHLWKIRKAGGSSVFIHPIFVMDWIGITRHFKHHQPHTHGLTRSWMLQYLWQTDALMRTAECLKSLSKISSVQYDKNTFIYFFLSALKLPKPHLLCGNLKFIKCYSMITFTYSVFDLLSPNYHKAVQRRASYCLFFCATVIAFLILCGEEYWYCSSDLISQLLEKKG